MYRNRNDFNLRDSHGEWRVYGYGIGCMFASDYKAVGGFSSQIKGWGLEDEDLLNKFVTAPNIVVSERKRGLLRWACCCCCFSSSSSSSCSSACHTFVLCHVPLTRAFQVYRSIDRSTIHRWHSKVFNCPAAKQEKPLCA